MVAVAVEPRPDAPGAARPEGMASLPYQVPCWDQLEQRLIEWALDPSALEDDDLEPPTPEVLHMALRVVRQLRRQSDVQFSRVSPDGEGGLSFENRAGERTTVLNISPPDEMEMMIFSAGDLVLRQRC